MEDLRALYIELKEKFKSHETRIASLEDEMKENNSIVKNLELTMNNLSNKLDNTAKIADKLLIKLEKAEEEPKRFNNNLKQQAINSVIGTSIGMFIAFIIGMFVYYIKIR